MSQFVFALELCNKKYYVGRTNDIVKSFDRHRTGDMTSWTKNYPAQSIKELFHQEVHDSYDISLVLKYMNLYGTENVRGGPFASDTLEPIQLTMLSLLSKELPFDETRIVAVYACEENKFFVDSWPLCDLHNRFEAHKLGKANAPFTARFKAQSIVQLQIDAPMEYNHLRLTLKYMKLHGIQHVRGSIFSSGEVEHSKTETSFISRLMQISDGIYDDEGNLIESFD
jgi:predicted GIY-YIG superfamily endonuclease